MRTAARVFAAIKRFEALKSPFPRVPFSRRLTNPRLTPMEPALSGKPVNVYRSGAYDRERGGGGSIWLNCVRLVFGYIEAAFSK